jgi:hypothetical protein
MVPYVILHVVISELPSFSSSRTGSQSAWKAYLAKMGG